MTYGNGDLDLSRLRVCYTTQRQLLASLSVKPVRENITVLFRPEGKLRRRVGLVDESRDGSTERSNCLPSTEDREHQVSGPL